MPKYDAIVADASPLISLEKLPRGFSLLARACSTLWVPEAVASEVSVFLDEGIEYFEHHGVCAAVTVEIIPNHDIPLDDEREEMATLGAGERYAIALAKARELPLLVEERRARRLARDLGMRGFGAAVFERIVQVLPR